MSRLLLLTAAAVAMMACTAAAPAGNATPPAAPAATDAPVPSAPPAATEASARHTTVSASAAWCDVRVTPTRNGALFEAVARGDALVGYELVITKRDAGGSSDITQAGEAVLTGASQVLGSAEISLERGARFSATLSLSEGGVETCTAEARS